MANHETTNQDMNALQEKIEELQQQNNTLQQETQQLRERLEWLQTFFDHAPVGFLLESKGGWVIESNRKIQSMLGYTGEELRGKAFTEFSHPDDLPAEQDLFEQLHVGDCDSYTNEKRYVCKDGQSIRGRVHVSFLRDPQHSSQPVVIGIVEEIKEP